MARRQISAERKAVYYVGCSLVVIGFLCFGSVFVSGAMHFGDFTNFKEQARSEMTRAIIGMGLIILGGIASGVGASGAAGSGIVLDPEQARKDVEPWSRMQGGMLKDALDEAGVELGRGATNEKPDFSEQLRELHRLREDGILTEEEYQAKKKEILARV